MSCKNGMLPSCSSLVDVNILDAVCAFTTTRLKVSLDGARFGNEEG
jgi:hypothetical protein